MTSNTTRPPEYLAMAIQHELEPREPSGPENRLETQERSLTDDHRDNRLKMLPEPTYCGPRLLRPTRRPAHALWRRRRAWSAKRSRPTPTTPEPKVDTIHRNNPEAPQHHATFCHRSSLDHSRPSCIHARLPHDIQ
jgi:hypothetical protein